MRKLTLAAVSGLSLALAACGSGGDADGETAAISEPSNDPVPEQLAGTSGFSKIAGALETTGVGTMFDGKGSYTLIAPTDAAFEKLGDAAKALEGKDGNAAMAALLKDHIVTGYSTLDDIKAAIAAGGGSAKLATVGGGEVTFSEADGTVMVEGPDGSKGTIGAEAMAGNNSIAMPVDTVLKKISA